MISHLLPTVLLTAVSVVAQSMPVPDGKGRILQVFDLERVQAPGDGSALAVPGDAGRQYLADFLRPFVHPPLAAGDDLQVLGGRWLALLGNPEQVANLEQLLANAAAKREVTVTATVRLARMPRPAFDRRLRSRLTVTPGADGVFEAVVPAASAAEVLAAATDADTESLTAPTVTVYPLQRANVSMRHDIAYVQDFTLTRKDDVMIADPVIAVVWDGVVTDLCATPLPDGTIGLRCDVQSQQVQRPIPKFETSLGVGAPVTIELPRTTGVHFRQTARLAPGDLIVLAAQTVDGDYLLAIVEAHPEHR